MKPFTLLVAAVGYYFGSKAGEQRYRQILWVGRTIGNSAAFKNLVSKAVEGLASVIESVTGERPTWLDALAEPQQTQQT